MNDPRAGFTLGFLGELDQQEGDLAGARLRFEEMLRLFRENGNPLGIAVALHRLGNLAQSEGDYPRARALLSDVLDRRRAIGGQRGTAHTLWSMGDLARLEGDYDRARALLEEALRIFRVAGAREVADALASLGDVARLRGDVDGAVAQLRESLRVLRGVGHRRGICRSLWRIGQVALEQGAPGRALRLFAAASTNAPRGAVLEPAERRSYDAGLGAARTALDEEAATQAWAEGQAMTLDQAIAYALGDNSSEG